MIGMESGGAVGTQAGAALVEEVLAADYLAEAEDRAEGVQVEAGKISPVVLAIQKAEARTSGEIRVHISQRMWDPHPLQSARYAFKRLGMFKTELRNGVLIYLNIRRKKAAIFGDKAIHHHIGSSKWEELLKKLIVNLQSTHFENAVAKTVEEVGEILAHHFPSKGGDRNELSDELSRD